MENDSSIFQNPNSKQPVQDAKAGAADFLSPPPSLSQSFPESNSSVQEQTPASPDPVAGGYDQVPKKSIFSRFKKVLSILASVFIILGLIIIVANFIFNPANKNSPSSQVTLTYWGLFEDQSVMQGIISDFEKQNPQIKIDYMKKDISQYRNMLSTRIANGTGPDIFRFHNTWYPMLKNVLLPLPSETISPEEFRSVYYPVVQKDLVKNGAIYGIPLEIDTLALFINNQLFQAAGLNPPTNWDDFVNDAKALTVKDTSGKIITAGTAMGTFTNITHAPDIMSLLFLENGVDLNNLKASSSKISDALIFYTSFAYGENSVWDNTLDPSQLAFAKGNLGMFFGYTSDYFAIKKFSPNLSFLIVPVPQLPGQSINLASYWAEGVSVRSKYQKEALLFMKFLTKKEVEQKLYTAESKVRDFGEPFARVDLADSLKTNPLVYPFVLQADSASSSYFVDGTNDGGLNQQLNTYLQDLLSSSGASGFTAANKDKLDSFIDNSVQAISKY